jgi:alkylation response protein AidB-like acyl-CoA dehydrogenase
MTAPLDRATIAALTGRLPQLGDPADRDARIGLLRTLYAVGRDDLPAGRLFEGHVDALQIVSRYGDPAQRRDVHDRARNGAVFGVWNADLPGEPITLRDGRLTGAKAFASGAGLLSHALVPVPGDSGRQLVLVDLDRTPPTIDRSWWRVTGMQRSDTHIVRWRDQAVGPDALIGAPDDYVREPWFSGGAIRFAAVQAGGIAGVVDRVRAHLVAHARAQDPHQAARLAELYLAAQAAARAVAAAAEAWRDDDVAPTVAHVAAARVAVYDAGERVLTLAQAAVGVQAMFVDHPLSAMLGDLSVYLRQPGPDAQRLRTGAAVAAGLLTPSL